MTIRPVLEAGDGRDGAVVDGDVVNLQVFLPAGELLLRVGARSSGVSAVDEGNHVGIEGDHLADGAGGVGEGPEETEGLVGVLVAVAPGAPEDALAPVFADARGGGEDVAEAGSEDDFAGGDGSLKLGGCVRGGDNEVGVFSVAGGDVGDGAVDHGDGAVVGKLLAGCPAEVGGGDALGAD